MADETSTPQATPAKGKRASGDVQVRLISAGFNDAFQVGDLEITPHGTVVPAAIVDDLIEIAVQHSVALVFEPVAEEK